MDLESHQAMTEALEWAGVKAPREIIATIIYAMSTASTAIPPGASPAQIAQIVSDMLDDSIRTADTIIQRCKNTPIAPR